MTVLRLGVIDIPYANASEETGKQRSARLRKGKTAPKMKSESITTGDVAEILEAKYHPIEIYWELHGQAVADKMTEGLVGAMENLLSGAPLGGSPFAEAEEHIDSGYKEFINSGELDRLGYPGLPTKAAIKGVSHRFKKKRGGQRPSLVDTGLYVAAFKSEIEE